MKSGYIFLCKALSVHTRLDRPVDLNLLALHGLVHARASLIDAGASENNISTTTHKGNYATH